MLSNPIDIAPRGQREVPPEDSFSTGSFSAGLTAATVELPESPRALPASDPPGAPTPHIKVLIVEDDARSARMLQANLSAAGYRVELAPTPEEAQRLALLDPPELILCDICLPGMDGIQLTRWFRAQAATKNVPLALVTSTNDSKVLARGLDAGADDFLTKPVNSLELRTRVRSLLRTTSMLEGLAAREQAAMGFAMPRSNEPAQHEFPAAKDIDSAPPSILIVEDNEQEARLLEAFVGEIGGTVRVTHSAAAAMESLEKEPPSLIILDLILPDRSGYELIEQLSKPSSFDRIPILVVSAMTQVEDRVRALECGADDFIVKGFDRIEFLARVRRLLRLKQNFDQLSGRCNRALQLAVTDNLTGLYTRGFFQEALEQQLHCARRYRQPLSLIFIDVDHFKQINDQYGHAAGDAVLKALAGSLLKIFRRSDVVVRYGGEEFVVLLPHTSRSEAAVLANRVRAEAEALAVPLPGAPGTVRSTISIGVATFPDNAADATELLKHADAAMYSAKQAGRNGTVVFGENTSAGPKAFNILIVDDDAKNLRLLEAYLSPEGYQLLKASDGVEAVDVARRMLPDLILLDAMMPRLSGFDVCRQLKQDKATQLIPVVLITALSSREDKLRGIEAGADDFLRKPLDKVELLTRTRALLRTKGTTDSLEDAEAVIFTLARAVEGRDPSTGDHVERVAQYAVALGKEMGIAGPELEGLRRAGVVHDIGKIVVPDAILLKQGKLTPEERKVIERHVEAGYDLLRPLRTFSECLPAVRFHHERRDGSGYPFGLCGDQIPITAQILGVVDVFDALTSDRVYRKAMSTDEAIAVLREETSRGLHDPSLVEKFISLVSQPATG